MLKRWFPLAFANEPEPLCTVADPLAAHLLISFRPIVIFAKMFAQVARPAANDSDRDHACDLRPERTLRQRSASAESTVTCLPGKR